jgi:hypothetical protein
MCMRRVVCRSCNDDTMTDLPCLRLQLTANEAPERRSDCYKLEAGWLKQKTVARAERPRVGD